MLVVWRAHDFESFSRERVLGHHALENHASSADFSASIRASVWHARPRRDPAQGASPGTLPLPLSHPK
jgi:hypothetical protein